MSCLRKIKGKISGIICLALMLTMLVPFTSNVFAANLNPTDVILVIDDTRSMLTTDPNKLSSLAIKKFVEKLPDGEDIKLGIATYCVDIMQNIPLTSDKGVIISFADTGVTQSGKGTDAAVGLNWAINELQTNSNDARTKAIILVGDGENSFVVNNQNVRTDAESNAMRDAAIATAQSKGIAVYTIAINPPSAEFSKYFSDIAGATNGQAHEPKTAAEVDSTMDVIFTSITGAQVNPVPPVPLQPNVPVTQEFDVPDGVFEMSLQCDHAAVIDIYFNDPAGDRYDENTAQNSGNTVKVSKQNSFTTFKIYEPVSGKWKVTYLSSTAQTIYPKFIFHADMAVSLSKNQKDILQGDEVDYIASVTSKGEVISDNNVLKDFDANLVVKDENGDETKHKMAVKKGEFSLSHAINDPGKYSVYAEIVGPSKTIKSNTITVDVAKDGSLMPLWAKLLIVAGILILIILIVVIVLMMRNRPDYVKGNVSIKIVGRLPDDETMVFQPATFSCDQIFSKKNTLTDLIGAYVRWYRSINDGSLAEMTLNQYINATLSEVSDKITICGNKKKQIVVKVPAGYEMEVDGTEVSKLKTMAFRTPERNIELRFKNMGCSYLVNILFSKDQY